MGPTLSLHIPAIYELLHQQTFHLQCTWKYSRLQSKILFGCDLLKNLAVGWAAQFLSVKCNVELSKIYETRLLFGTICRRCVTNQFDFFQLFVWLHSTHISFHCAIIIVDISNVYIFRLRFSFTQFFCNHG